MKTTEQMRDDKAVHVFFSQLIAQMTKMELANLNKQEKRQYAMLKRQMLEAEKNG